jgi:organic radical activating enzyme
MHKIIVPNSLEINVAFECNQQCAYCSHFAPYFAGVVPLHEIEQSCAEWSRIIEPKHATIMGGEPTIHPEITEIVHIFGKYWDNVLLMTNGTNLHRLPPAFFDALEQTNTRVLITINHHTKKHEGAIREFVRNKGIKNCRINNRKFTRQYHLIENRPVPFDNPQICRGNGQLTIMDHKLYKCSSLPRAIRYYNMPDDYYATVHDDVRKFLATKYHCQFCPDREYHYDGTPGPRHNRK